MSLSVPALRVVLLWAKKAQVLQKEKLDQAWEKEHVRWEIFVRILIRPVRARAFFRSTAEYVTDVELGIQSQLRALVICLEAVLVGDFACVIVVR